MIIRIILTMLSIQFIITGIVVLFEMLKNFKRERIEIKNL